MKSNERTSTKRSASLRSQRVQQAQERISQASERARHPNSMPPVMTRGNMAGAPGSRRKVTQTNVRRKVYYSLGNSGAEVRLPAMPVFRPSWRMLSGALSVALLAMIWAMLNASMFQVSKVRVQGAQRIPVADISSALGLEGLSILDANPPELVQTLQNSFPDLAKASVQVGLPASVAVKVQERQPVINWQGDKDALWIDASGMAFPPRGKVDGLINVSAKGNPPAPADPTQTAGQDKAGATPQPTPTATAIAPAAPGQPGANGPARAFMSVDLLAAIQKLSSQAPKGTPILYDSRYGLGWKDPQGWTVYFGSNIDDMDLKLQQYKVITGELAKQKIVPAMISVEFPHAPFYRLEP